MPQRGLTVLLLILLLVNALLLAAVFGVFGPEPLAGWMESPREPQRLEQQMRGERMQLIAPPAGTGAAEPGAPTPSPAPGGPAGSPRGVLPGNATPGGVSQSVVISGVNAVSHVPAAAVATTVAAVATAAGQCVEIGGFSALAVRNALEDLGAIAAGSPLPIEQFERQEQARWWVHLPAQPTRENADRKLAELRRRNVTDVSLVSAEDPASYTVSLGLFRERARADRFLESLRGQGVRTAVVTDAPRPVSRQWLRVKSADDAVRARMEEVRQRYGAEDLRACGPGGNAGTQARAEPAAARVAG